ncbi:DMT family transporter [Pararhizobium sp. IMCC21322]|uniref:DMT family transporter n=1 Tax=Pararhizobium sp. IMCC21322 TaxID=3067903 RepID=UPI002740FA4C|nr:DMT family transporter [Pararhizobium sp. IMCC21322]
MSGLTAKANEDRVMSGILLMLGAYLFFAFVDVSAKWLAIAGLSALQLSFMRYLGHFLISLFLIGKGGFSFNRFSSERMVLVVLRAALLMASTILNFSAVAYLPLTLTSTILFSTPIIICALSWPLLGERVGFWRWSAIMIGFVGILIAIRPFDSSFHWAVTLSLSAAFCFALYSILTRKLAGVVAVDTLQFYSGFVGTVALLPFAIFTWQTPTNGLDWTIMLVIGVFGWLGHQLLTNAHRFAPASTLTPFGYTFILYLAVASFLIFDHLPDRWTLIGGAIIIVAGLLIWFREKQLSPTAN